MSAVISVLNPLLALLQMTEEPLTNRAVTDLWGLAANLVEKPFYQQFKTLLNAIPAYQVDHVVSSKSTTMCCTDLHCADSFDDHIVENFRVRQVEFQSVGLQEAVDGKEWKKTGQCKECEADTLDVRRDWFHTKYAIFINKGFVDTNNVWKEMPPTILNLDRSEFDRLPNELIWVDRMTATYTKHGEIRSRSQFPIDLAFCGDDSQKSSLTLKNVILATKSIFADAQFFVGASRVKTLQGLHFVDIDFEKVKADKEAIQEYARLKLLPSLM
ncbi:hypothetical protein CRE_06754 [Caenorhabditis remanei]|uniref:Uncharacterized protein n=1 Tax=Caenorhabditis remanei TaxID=31234 RepID=E3MNY9_CAERE|nr:hypothetical protein CRE_06754 [Caenorhabditis remanei]